MKEKKGKGIGCAAVFIILPIPAVIIYGLVSENFDLLHGLIYGGIISLVFLIFTVISSIKEKKELRRLEKVEAFRAQNAAQSGSAPDTAAPEVSTRSEEQISAPTQKNKSKAGIAALAVLLAAVLGVGGFFGFREGGWFRGKVKTYDAQSMQSLSDYAKQLEKAGNSEAAEAVYEIMAQGGGAELIEKAHEDIPVIKQFDELERLKDIFSDRKGGGSDE